MRALDEFTGALAANDAAVARFMDDFGAVSQQLAGEKQELQASFFLEKPFTIESLRASVRKALHPESAPPG